MDCLELRDEVGEGAAECYVESVSRFEMHHYEAWFE